MYAASMLSLVLNVAEVVYMTFSWMKSCCCTVEENIAKPCITTQAAVYHHIRPEECFKDKKQN